MFYREVEEESFPIELNPVSKPPDSSGCSYIEIKKEMTLLQRFSQYFRCFTHQPADKMQLKNITWKDTSIFVPPVTEGHVIKVYDGDTITIATQLPIKNTPIYRFSVRLAGIDSAEMKGKGFHEKELAIQARETLTKKIIGQTVRLKNVSLEKYGRLLADVYLDNLHINRWMVDQGLAVEYDGGTKNRPPEWD